MVGTVRIAQLEVECLIGVMKREREVAQRVEVDLELSLDFSAAGRSDALKDTWNYAHIAQQVAFVLRAGQFYLLEAATTAVARYLLLPPVAGDPRPTVQSAKVTLTKFGVLPGDATPIVTAAFELSELEFPRETKDWGTVDVIHETPRMGLYRLNIAPGATLPNHMHRRMRESEMVLDEGLEGWRDGVPTRPLPVLESVQWPHGVTHGYRNVSERPASILCLDAPPFDPSDEIEVPR